VGKAQSIWEFHPENRSVPKQHLISLIETLTAVEQKKQFAFTVFDKEDNSILGLARIFQIDWAHKTVEIGTWLSPNAWGAGFNTEIKYLLLHFCFEELKMFRVQFKTDVLNVRSQRALEKLGASMEGCIRKERITWKGTPRDVHIYSIIDDEWSMIKSRLEARFSTRPSSYKPPFVYAYSDSGSVLVGS
jgi:N-acetyltransferase